MKLLARLLPPPRQWNDSLFRSQARAIRWGGSWSLMRVYTLTWALHMVIMVIGTWLIFAVIQALVYQSSGYFPDEWFLAYTQGYWGVALFISVAANLVIDFGGMAAGAGAISSEIAAGRFDLIRVSLLRPGQIVVGKYVLAQVKAWRDTVRVMWLRLVVVVGGIGIAAWTVLAGRLAQTGSGQSAFDGLFPYLLSSVAGALFIIEPYWRMKAVTAIGVAVSARSLSGMGATLATGLAVLAFWFGQLVIFAGLMFCLSTSAWIVFLGEAALAVCAPLFAVGIGAVIYGFYSIVQQASLRHAAWRLATMESE